MFGENFIKITTTEIGIISNTFDFVFTCDLDKSSSIMSILPTTTEEYKVYQAAKTARKST